MIVSYNHRKGRRKKATCKRPGRGWFKEEAGSMGTQTGTQEAGGLRQEAQGLRQESHGFRQEGGSRGAHTGSTGI